MVCEKMTTAVEEGSTFVFTLVLREGIQLLPERLLVLVTIYRTQISLISKNAVYRLIRSRSSSQHELQECFYDEAGKRG